MLASPETVPRTKVTAPLLDLCQKLSEFLHRQLHRQSLGQPLAESLEQKPDGEFCVRKSLPMGITLLASLNKDEKKTTLLQIFFDPPRFKSWRNSLGPCRLVFLDPFGLEIGRNPEENSWGVYIGGRELSMDLETNSIYEMACLEINKDNKGVFSVVRLK